jgi:hypothetical protein
MEASSMNSTVPPKATGLFLTIGGRGKGKGRFNVCCGADNAAESKHELARGNSGIKASAVQTLLD